jgi:gluconolactonase
MRRISTVVKKIWFVGASWNNSKLVSTVRRLAVLLLVSACTASPPAPSAPPPAGEPDAAPREAAAPTSEAPITPAIPDATADTSPPPIVPDASPPPAGEFPIDKLMAAKPELYATMSGHLEGVSWRGGEVFFSAIPRGLFRVDIDRKIAPVISLSSNGTFVLGDGTLLVCDDRNAMVQIFKDGKVGVLGTAGPKCNDLTVDGWGNIYFSDFEGTVFRITPRGEQTKAVTGLRNPNGVEVDRESRFLYIMPRPADIYRVAITESGPTGMPEKLGTLDGVTDGCAFDAWGNLWVSVYYGGKIGVFDPVKKQLLGYVPAGGSGLTNMTFGGPDRDTIFTTVDNKGIYRIPIGIAGFPGHPGAAQYTVKSYLPAMAK